MEVEEEARKGRVENYFVKTILSTPDLASNLELHVIDSLVYYESSAFDHADTEESRTVSWKVCHGWSKRIIFMLSWIAGNGEIRVLILVGCTEGKVMLCFKRYLRTQVLSSSSLASIQQEMSKSIKRMHTYRQYIFENSMNCD
uniref:Uncharacterized protein n=1 Tax=Timema tahoe TaxID=61484 RepID=A0A7R9FJU3_9NEOP|nr:unnamed protein product [Timema tahoe]